MNKWNNTLCEKILRECQQWFLWLPVPSPGQRPVNPSHSSGGALSLTWCLWRGRARQTFSYPAGLKRICSLTGRRLSLRQPLPLCQVLAQEIKWESTKGFLLSQGHVFLSPVTPSFCLFHAEGKCSYHVCRPFLAIIYQPQNLMSVKMINDKSPLVIAKHLTVIQSGVNAATYWFYFLPWGWVWRGLEVNSGHWCSRAHSTV